MVTHCKVTQCPWLEGSQFRINHPPCHFHYWSSRLFESHFFSTALNCNNHETGKVSILHHGAVVARGLPQHAFWPCSPQNSTRNFQTIYSSAGCSSLVECPTPTRSIEAYHVYTGFTYSSGNDSEPTRNNESWSFTSVVLIARVVNLWNSYNSEIYKPAAQMGVVSTCIDLNSHNDSPGHTGKWVTKIWSSSAYPISKLFPAYLRQGTEASCDCLIGAARLIMLGKERAIHQSQLQVN